MLEGGNVCNSRQSHLPRMKLMTGCTHLLRAGVICHFLQKGFGKLASCVAAAFLVVTTRVSTESSDGELYKKIKLDLGTKGLSQQHQTL